MFLMFVDDHHGDGRLAVWCKCELPEQQRMVREDPERFFVPPYVGVKGWVGVRVDAAVADWSALAILVEEGWLAVAPKSLATGDRALVRRERRPPPPRPRTDPEVARAALEKLARVALALPEATCVREAKHATFRVRKKPFVYFLDNHHGDGVVAACVRLERKKHAALVASEPRRFYVPAYIGSKGWIGVRLDRRVDWKDLGARIQASYRAVAPRRLLA
jgi:hypothetical protein